MHPSLTSLQGLSKQEWKQMVKAANRDRRAEKKAASSKAKKKKK